MNNPRECGYHRPVKYTCPLLLCSFVATSCGEEAETSVVRNVSVPACPAREDAPLPDGRGGVTCLRVGADTVAATRAVPALDGLPAPVVHVRGGAVGGDGSEARPFASLADALSRLTAGGTIAVHRGDVRIEGVVMVPRGVALVGVGPTVGTMLVVTRGHAGLSVAQDVQVRDLAIRYEGSDAREEDAAVEVAAGATVTLRNVRIEGAYEGLRVFGEVSAERLSVLRAARNGIALRGAAVGRFRSLLVRDGLAQGVSVGPAEVLSTVAGHLHITDGAVLDNGERGVVFSRAATGVGAAECTTDGPSTAAGELDCFTRVSIERNGIQALAVRGARDVRLRRVSLSGTRVIGADRDADGLAALDGARVTIDDPESAAMRTPGIGSIIVGNARAGVLAQGAGVQLTVRGARVQSNLGPGVFIAQGASAPVVSFNRVDDNRAVGVAVTRSATIASIQCNGISGTLAAPLVTTDGTGAPLGDGLSIVQGGTRVDVSDNTMTANARFGAVFSGASGTVHNNDGAGNLYGLHAYDSPTLAVTGDNRVGGREAAPTVAPPQANSL